MVFFENLVFLFCNYNIINCYFKELLFLCKNLLLGKSSKSFGYMYRVGNFICCLVYGYFFNYIECDFD